VRVDNFRYKAFGALLILITSGAPSRGEVLASVGGKVVTEADVIAAFGYMPKGEALREAVGGLVERDIILALAEGKALAAEPDEVTRAAASAAKTRRPAGDVNSETFRRYLAEEITIAKYIDLYIFPRIKVEEKALMEYFLERPSLFMTRPPRDRAALRKLFPRHRNEVLYRYIQSEIKRLLRAAGNAARAGLDVEIYV
jgi:hypothetical protein